jgi:hypothetical protein
MPGSRAIWPGKTLVHRVWCSLLRKVRGHAGPEEPPATWMMAASPDCLPVPLLGIRRSEQSRQECLFSDDILKKNGLPQTLDPMSGMRGDKQLSRLPGPARLLDGGRGWGRF